jgi:hypothetical protein
MISNIKTIVEENKTAAFFCILTITLVAFMAIASGCDLQKMTSLDVPTNVKYAIEPGFPANGQDKEYSLADANRIVTDWQNFVRTGSEQLSYAVADAQERHAVLSSFVDLGLVAAHEVAPTLPGGAFLVGGLSLLTGLFIRRPGDADKLAKEKRDSYNKGIEVGASLAVKIPDPSKGDTQA